MYDQNSMTFDQNSMTLHVITKQNFGNSQICGN